MEVASVDERFKLERSRLGGEVSFYSFSLSLVQPQQPTGNDHKPFTEQPSSTLRDHGTLIVHL